MANQNTYSQMQGIDVGGQEVNASNPLPIMSSSAKSYRFIEVTFDENATQSSVIELANGEYITAINMGDAWTTSGFITFLATHASDGTYGPVVEDTGIEAQVPEPAAGFAANQVIPLVMCAMDMKAIAGQYVKLRSGTAASEVAQLAARTLTVEVQRL